MQVTKLFVCAAFISASFLCTCQHLQVRVLGAAEQQLAVNPEAEGG